MIGKPRPKNVAFHSNSLEEAFDLFINEKNESMKNEKKKIINEKNVSLCNKMDKSEDETDKREIQTHARIHT